MACRRFVAVLQRDGHLEELAFDFTSTPDRELR